MINFISEGTLGPKDRSGNTFTASATGETERHHNDATERVQTMHGLNKDVVNASVNGDKAPSTS